MYKVMYAGTLQYGTDSGIFNGGKYKDKDSAIQAAKKANNRLDHGNTVVLDSKDNIVYKM